MTRPPGPSAVLRTRVGRATLALAAGVALVLPIATSASATSGTSRTAVATGAAAHPNGHPGKPKPKAKPKPKPRPSYPATVSVGGTPLPGSLAIPADYVGLSFESGQLRSPELQPATGNLGNLMKSIAPGLVRFGGDSVENEWYSDGYTPPPSWAVVRITDDNFQNLADLLDYSGWKTELTVELVHDDPVNAAEFVQAAYGILGSNLVGIEIGNEPDIYLSSFADYKSLYDSYADAIHQVVPGMPIVGPNTGNPQWLAAFAPSASATSPVTQHLYALSRCGTYVPQISDLLSRTTQAQELAFVQGGLAPARAAGVPLRVDESNSVACGGQDGVSNVLAASLWGTDYLLRLAQLGVAGINLHSGLGNCHGYTPLCQPGQADRLANVEQARPLWYAMLLVHSLAGDRFLPLHASTPDGRLVSAFAVIDPRGTVKVVLDDMDVAAGTPDARVRVRVPRSLRSASVARLVGPGLAATESVTFGGGAVAQDGTFAFSGPVEHAPGDHGDFTVVLRPGSAAVLTFSSKPLPPPRPVKSSKATHKPAKGAVAAR